MQKGRPKVALILPAEERPRLKSFAHPRSAAALARRARIILASAEGTVGQLMVELDVGVLQPDARTRCADTCETCAGLPPLLTRGNPATGRPGAMNVDRGGPARRYYQRTRFGRAVARAESERLRALLDVARAQNMFGDPK